MRKRGWYAVIVLLCLFLRSGAGYAGSGTKIYYVRHAETMGNVTRNYTDENQRIFSEYGKSQVAGIADKLGQYEFDYIAVSPTWRTRQTVLPYLKAQDRVGYIWPEIEEGGCGLQGGIEPASELEEGAPIEILPENSSWFSRRDEETTHRYEQRNDEDSLAVYLRGVDLLNEQFGGTGRNVLLVSHSCTGSRLFELLLGITPRGRFSPMNASVTLLEEKTNGVYSLVQFNDKPFKQSYSWTEPSFALNSNQTLQMNRTLNAEYFGEASADPYRVDWIVRGTGGAEMVLRGSRDFSLSENTEGKLVDIQIDLDGVALGTGYTMDMNLSRGGQLLQEWTEEQAIPFYYDLSGAWLIHSGDDAAWSEMFADDRAWKITAVPGSWEQDALPGYDGTAWYRYHFSVPKMWRDAWGDKPLAITFGGIDDADYTYLNGTLIGQSGQFPPDEKTAYDKQRIYPVEQALLKEDDNVLAVRVSDWMGAGGIWKCPVAIGPVEGAEEK